MSDDTLGSLVVEYKADLTGLQAGSARAKAEMRSVDDVARSSGSGFSTLKFMAANALMDVGRQAVDAGVATLKMAGDFESGVTSLVTGAGESQKNIAMVRTGMLGLATDTGTTTKQLEAGMYMIESGGYHGKQGLDILKAAAEGAKVGSADLGVTADATDTILKNFGSTGLTAAQAVNDLIATVSHGKTHMQDLAASLSQILPTASAARISLSDVSGAMATMTGEGVPAAQAATYLRQTIIALEAPGSKAVSTLKSIGLTTADVSTEMQHSLPGALQLITDHLKNKFPEGSAAYVEAVKNISGGSRTMQGMLDLTGAHLQTLKDNVLTIADAVKQGGNSIVGWSNVQDTFNQKLDKAKEIIETAGIALGEKLIPVVSQGIDEFSRFATSLENTTSPLDTFGQNIVDTVQKSGAFQSVLQTVKDTLPGVEQFVGNVADAFANKLLPPTLDLIKNFSTWLDKSNILTDGLHALGDEVETVATILAPFIQDLSNVFNWLSQNKPATDALVTAVEILGGAFLALKVYDQIVGFQNMFTKLSTGEGIVSDLANVFRVKLGGAVSDFVGSQAPNLKGAFSDIGGKAKAAGQDVASIGANAETSAAEVSAAATVEEGDLTAVDTKVKAVNADLIATGPAAAEGGAAAKLGLSGLVDTLGTIAGFAGLLALPFIIFPQFQPKPDPLADSSKYIKQLYDQLNTNFAQMINPANALNPQKLIDAYQKWSEASKILSDPKLEQAYIKQQQAIQNVADTINKGRIAENLQHMKDGIDGLGKAPGVHIVDGDIIKLGTDINKVTQPAHIPLDIPKAGEVHNKLLDLNGLSDHLQKPVDVKIDTPTYGTVHTKLLELNKGRDDLNKPATIHVNTGSLDAALGKASDLLNTLFGIESNTPSVSVGPLVTGAPFRGHASGGFSPIGEPFLFNEQGPELGMAVPGGVQIWSHAQSMQMLGGGGSGEVHVHVTNIIDGQVMTDQMGGHLIKTLYKSGPVKAGV